MRSTRHLYATNFVSSIRDNIDILLLCPGTVIDGKPIITLPSKTVNLTKVEFSVEERAFYRKLEADSRSQFKVLLISKHPFISVFLL